MTMSSLSGWLNLVPAGLYVRLWPQVGLTWLVTLTTLLGEWSCDPCGATLSHPGEGTLQPPYVSAWAWQGPDLGLGQESVPAGALLPTGPALHL